MQPAMQRTAESSSNTESSATHLRNLSIATLSLSTTKKSGAGMGIPPGAALALRQRTTVYL
jgi:hypothetical protein